MQSTTTRIQAARGSDEVGELVKSVAELCDDAKQANSLREDNRRSEAKATETRRAETARLADAFEGSIKKVAGEIGAASTRLHGSAGTLSQTAAAASSKAGMAGVVAEEASRDSQTVAAATEELSASISEIGRQVKHSSAISFEAVPQARRADDLVAGLDTAATRIGDVTNLISDIASQTS